MHTKHISSHWAESTLLPNNKCVCVCVCVCVRACVRACVRVCLWFMRTQICIMTWVWHRYYKENMIYENIFSVPIIQKEFPVRAKFRCRVDISIEIGFVQYKNHYTYTRVCVCVCVCVRACVCVNYIIHMFKIWSKGKCNANNKLQL